MKVKQLLEARGHFYTRKSDNYGISNITMTNLHNPPSVITVAKDGKSFQESSDIEIFYSQPRKWKEYLNRYYLSSRTEDTIDTILTTLRYPTSITSSDEYNEFIANLKYHKQDLDALGFIKSRTFSSVHNAAVFCTTNLKLNPIIVEKLLGIKLDDIVQSHDTTINVGDSKIIFPDNIQTTRKENIIKLIEAANVVLERQGMKKLLNTTIIVAPITQHKTIGLYFPDTKQIKIDPAAKAIKTALHTIIHEYGHKFMNEFMTPENKEKVINKFNEVIANPAERAKSSASYLSLQQEIVDINDKIMKDYITDISKSIKVGDTVTYKGRKKNWSSMSPYTIKEIDGTKISIHSDNHAYGVLAGDISSFTNKGFSVNGKELQVKLMEPEEDEGIKEAAAGWFPTMYSRTNYSEWFAELFAFYMLAKLKDKEVIEFIKSLL